MFQVIVLKPNGSYFHTKVPDFATAERILMQELEHSGMGWFKAEPMGPHRNLGVVFYGINKYGEKLIVGQALKIETEDFGCVKVTD